MVTFGLNIMEANVKIVGHMNIDHMHAIQAVQAKRYKVIEDRGCDIQYDHKLDLTEEEAYLVAEEMNFMAQDNPYLWNGNNVPFIYRMEEY